MRHKVKVDLDVINKVYTELVWVRYEAMKATHETGEGSPASSRLAAINRAVESAIEQLKQGVKQLGDLK